MPNPHEDQRRDDAPKISHDIHYHYHYHYGASDEQLCQLFCGLTELKQQLCAAKEEIMASITTFGDLLAAMNEVTNTIAANITALLARIDAGGLSAAEEAQVEAALQAQLDALRAVAASSSAPVPPVPTPPTP